MNFKNIYLFIFSLVFSVNLNFSALAYDYEQVERVRFARGKSGTVLQGSVVRLTRNIYVLGAAKGQMMTVRIRSLENNAVIQIMDPKGRTLKGGGENEDITYWKGRLPLNGDYRIAVAATRGNASYELEVSIR